MRRINRLLSFVLSAAMLFCLIPGVSAVNDQEAITYGPSIGAGVSAIQDGQTLVFGKDGTTWYVLDNGLTTTGVPGLALISDSIVNDNVAFNKSGLENSWANSYAKTWNAEYAASAFSAGELEAIMATTKSEQAGTYFGANWGNDALVEEKLFFLSAAEIQDYFADSVDGLIGTVEDDQQGWWLRSAYTDRAILGGIVSDAGFVGATHVASAWGARPAFNISADKIVMTSAAVGGKVSGEIGANGLTAVSEASSNLWKLTVVDAAHSSFTASINSGAALENTIGYESWVVPVTYSGAVAGENEYVSVIIRNQNDAVVYYGHIAQNSASGTVNVNMPAGLSGKYTISVFAEQCNGDNATDFASALVSADIVISDNISSVDSWGLILQGDIEAVFRMNLSDAVVTDDTAYVLVTVDDVTTKYMVSNLVADDNGLYDISANVAAAQMTEDIIVQVFTAETEGNRYLYSVKKYGDAILAGDYDEDLCNLVRAMLNYGGAAQDYFNYNLGDKADNGISISKYSIPYTENLAAKKSGSSANVKYYGSSLIHEHQTNLRFYFTSTDEAIKNVTFTASCNGTVIDSDMYVVKSGDMYYVQVSDIAPNNLCDEITISVDGFTVTYSPFYYIHRMYYKSTSSAALRDLMSALYNYYCYAVAYSA